VVDLFMLIILAHSTFGGHQTSRWYIVLGHTALVYSLLTVTDMEVDVDVTKSSKPSKSGKGRIERKRSSRKAAIVFPKYKKGGRVSKSTKSKK